MWFKCLHKSLVCCQIDYQCNFGKATRYFNSSALPPLWSGSVAPCWGRLIMRNVEHLCWEEEERFLALTCFPHLPETSSIYQSHIIVGVICESRFFHFTVWLPPSPINMSPHVAPVAQINIKLVPLLLGSRLSTSNSHNKRAWVVPLINQGLHYSRGH